MGDAQHRGCCSLMGVVWIYGGRYNVRLERLTVGLLSVPRALYSPAKSHLDIFPHGVSAALSRRPLYFSAEALGNK